jgi:hypothetical protein
LVFSKSTKGVAAKSRLAIFIPRVKKKFSDYFKITTRWPLVQ